MSRGPAHDITEETTRLVEGMATVGGTNTEIAAFMDCNETQIRRNYKKVLAKARASMKTRLRQAQYKVALGGNPTMLIWLGKQMLEQKDRQEITHKDLDTNEYTVAQLEHIARGGSLAKLPRK